MKLLLVHGRSQGGKDPVKLKTEWMEALSRGLTKAGLNLPAATEVGFPFYGDQLDEFVRQFDLPADPAIIPKGSSTFNEYAEFRRQVATEMAVRAGITEAAISQEMGAAPTEKGVENWAWVQALVRLLDRNLAGISTTTIEVFLRDVFLYTRRPGVRRAIDAIISAQCGNDTAVVVGHSLGSVIAYNIIKAAEFKIPLFVTVGSPLSIRAVRQTLIPISNPAGARGRYNALDRRDIVALYPLDSENFNVAPAITNYTEVNNWTENRHSIIGYLDDANVAKAIYEGLRSG
jgi:hypothetical protein